MSEQSIPPSGFQPFKKPVKELSVLDKATDSVAEELKTALAGAITTGDFEALKGLIARAANLYADLLETEENPAVKRVTTLTQAADARKATEAEEDFDTQLADARKLLCFAREALAGTNPASPEPGAAAADALTEPAMFKLLELAGVGKEAPPTPLEAGLKGAQHFLERFLLQKASQVTSGHGARHHHHEPEPIVRVPAGGAVDPVDVDSTVAMQVLSYLAAQGLIDEDGQIDEGLWAAVRTAAAAQSAVRRA